MFYVLLVNLLANRLSSTNNPILITSSCPFNVSQQLQIECFSGDRSPILSLTIDAILINGKDVGENSTLPLTDYYLKNNESITINISTPLNYSQLYRKSECQCTDLRDQQKQCSLDVFSTADIAHRQLFIINAHARQTSTLTCLTREASVVVHRNFIKNVSTDLLELSPIDVLLNYSFVSNDTSVMDHVPHVYYDCFATDTTSLDITQEDKSLLDLNSKKNLLRIPMTIVCTSGGAFILALILCTKCHRKQENRRQSPKQEIVDRTQQAVPKKSSDKFLSNINHQISSEATSMTEQNSKVDWKSNSTVLDSKTSTKSPEILLPPTQKRARIKCVDSPSNFKGSPRFALGNPFLDFNTYPLTAVNSHEDKANINRFPVP